MIRNALECHSSKIGLRRAVAVQLRQDRAGTLIKSSIAGRKEPSGHRSPAGTTVIRRPTDCAHRATVNRVRQPATTMAPVDIAWNASDDPFGDGSTNRSPTGISTSEDGASENGLIPAAARTGHVGPALLGVGDGSLVFPAIRENGRARLTAMSALVENERTSTMMMTSDWAISTMPGRPHSQRISN